jgi:hypothetical protein
MKKISEQSYAVLCGKILGGECRGSSVFPDILNKLKITFECNFNFLFHIKSTDLGCDM